MDVATTKALQPVGASYGLALRLQEDRHPELSGRSHANRRDFVFLGYGPSREEPLYDASGKALEPRAGTGSFVDLYA